MSFNRLMSAGGAPFGELEQFCEGFYCVLVDFSGVKKLKNINL